MSVGLRLLRMALALRGVYPHYPYPQVRSRACYFALAPVVR